jgi:hypothetical protein
MGLFDKKITQPKTGVTEIKPLDYPSKVILVWGEAISGKQKYLDVLLKSEYKELGLFVYAMHNQDEARTWLMKNGFPHLLAMLNAIERKKDAILWLKAHKFTTLYHMAMCADGDKGSFAWLISNNKKDMAMIAKKIEFVKDYIEEGNNDIHSISI